MCKIFDIFHKETVLLLSILIRSYKNVYIHKPCISRESNSEKYIICKNFKGYDSKIINILCHGFNKSLNIMIGFANNNSNFPVINTVLHSFLCVHT